MAKKFQQPTQKTINGQTALNKGQAKRTSKKLDSEYQSYTYIKNELRDKGWNVNNPNRDAQGQLYTQHECLQNGDIAFCWGGMHSEYVVKLNEDAFWVIEAKPKLEDIDLAYKEAKGYGKLLNEHGRIRAMIITGVAGNDIDKYLVRNGFWVEEEKEFQSIVYDEGEITSLLTPDVAQRLLDEKTPTLKEFDIADKDLLDAADSINEVFRKASIRKDNRATVIATLLLSLLGKTDPNYNDTPDIFVNDINGRAEETLRRHGKEDFFKYIEIHLPEREDAKRKFKEALVQTLLTLRHEDILPAMRTPSDILGRFYETFLKYGNGAKDLGIVLTPRHITEFAAEVLNVNHRDIIYDPTCGTGGFLVSAFYRVKKNSSQSQLDSFRTHKIFGIDLQSTITTLAIVNMIFRGDGKNNIRNDDCLAQALVEDNINGDASARFVQRDNTGAKKVVTKVLMNPPFSQDEEEFVFVEHALKQMDDGGLLFAILPCSTMVKMGVWKSWRERLLENNTLLSVITLPEDIFYPQSQPQSLAIMVKKGTPHPKEQNVLWIKTRSDGYRKVKNKRIKSSDIPDEIAEVTGLIQSYLVNPNRDVQNVPEFQKACPIDFSAPDSEASELELIPEAYLDQKTPTLAEIRQGIEQVTRDTMAFMIMNRNLAIDEKVIKELFRDIQQRNVASGSETPDDNLLERLHQKELTSLFTLHTGDYHNASALSEGVVPLISCGDIDNGFIKLVDVPDQFVCSNKLTIAYNGQPLTTKYHPYSFAAKDDVAVCMPINELKPRTLVFIQYMVDSQKWRYSYGRKCFRERLSQLQLFVPTDAEGEIDEDTIEKIVADTLYSRFF
jgi:type I restriction enzyme M protein